MTHYTAADVDMADRHIAEGERHVARQEQIIAELQLAGHPVTMAERLLEQFRDSLAAHREHRGLIVAALEESGRDRDPS